MTLSLKSMQDTLKLLSAQVIIGIFSVVYFFIIALLFPKVEMAAIPVFSMIIGICSMLTGFGLTTTCVQKVPRFIAEGNKKDASNLIKASIILPVILSLVLAFIVFLFSNYISLIFFKTSEYSNLIKIMSIGIVSFKLNESLLLLIPATDRFGKLSLIRVLNGVFIPLFALSFYFVLNIEGYIIGLICGYMLSSGLIIYYLRDFIFYKSELGFHYVKNLVSYSIPYYLEGFMHYATNVDQFVIGIFLLPETLATYYVVRRFFDFLAKYNGVLTEPIVPKIAQIKNQGVEKIRRSFYMTSRYLSLALIPVCFLIASISYPLLQVFGGGKYINGALTLSILALSIIAYGLYSIYAMNVYVLGKPKLRLQQESVNGISNVILVFLLIKPLGIIGCALANFFSLFISMFFSKHLLKRLVRVKFDTDTLKQTLFASIVMSVIIILGQVIYYNILLILIYVLIGGILYLIITCRNLEKEDIDLIKSFLPKRFSFILRIVHLFGGKN